MNSPPITYVPRPDTTPEAEISALESIYELAIQRFEEKEAAPRQSRPESDAKESENGCTATRKYTRT